MSYTITSAAWANEENTAAVLQTTEAGAVLASAERADVWAAFQAWLTGGGSPSAYDAPTAEEINQLRRDEGEAILSDLSGLGKVERAIYRLIAKRLNLIHAQVVGQFSATIDPPSLANGNGTTQIVSVPGNPQGLVQFTDEVIATAPYSLQGLLCTGYVHAMNPLQVGVRLHNSTGGAINLTSGSWLITVRRPATLPQLTFPVVKNAVIDEINDAGIDNDT
jgi:hypothetical protein